MQKVPKELSKVYNDVGKIMVDGMDTSVDPCQDFYKFMFVFVHDYSCPRLVMIGRCGSHEKKKGPGFSWFNLAERKATQRLTMVPLPSPSATSRILPLI